MVVKKLLLDIQDCAYVYGKSHCHFFKGNTLFIIFDHKYKKYFRHNVWRCKINHDLHQNILCFQNCPKIVFFYLYVSFFLDKARMSGIIIVTLEVELKVSF